MTSAVISVHREDIFQNQPDSIPGFSWLVEVRNGGELTNLGRQLLQYYNYLQPHDKVLKLIEQGDLKKVENGIPYPIGFKQNETIWAPSFYLRSDPERPHNKEGEIIYQNFRGAWFFRTDEKNSRWKLLTPSHVGLDKF